MGLRSLIENIFPSRAPTASLEGSVETVEELKTEQRALADEIERLFRAFDERLMSLARRTHELTPETVEREADSLKTQQDALRRALRRLEAAAKQTGELERELEEWQAREPNGPLHADHPSIRAEILRSELALRGIQHSSVDSRESRVASDEAQVESRESIVDDDESSDFRLSTCDSLPETDVSHLVAAIREASREADRWHGLPADEHDEDALVQVKHLKELHAILKRLDRSQGIARDRLELGVNAREVR